MKTTIEIPDELLNRAKQAALERNTTLRVIVEEALQRALGPALGEVTALRTVTWGSPRDARSAPLDAGTVQAAIAREREGPLDDADQWLERFGFVAPGVRRK